MYVFDLFKRLFHGNNITIIIYLVINVAVIVAVAHFVFGYLGEYPLWMSGVIGLGAYFLSLLIALSPFGEWLLRVLNKCKKINSIEVINMIEPSFIEVKRKARELNPAIPDDVRLYITDSRGYFAYATGRRTICISEGLLELPEHLREAALAHEFGHLSHKDTDIILLVTVGNLIVNFILIGIKIFFVLFNIVVFLVVLITSVLLGEAGVGLGYLLSKLYNLAWLLIIGILTWIWTQIGNLLVMRASREGEYAADEFALNLGYGRELCELLDKIDTSVEKGLFATLMSSHPNKFDRINRLNELGAGYERY